MKKRILILMVESGSGHKSPAMAIRDSIEARYPEEYQIDVVDFAAACGAQSTDVGLKSFWDYLLARPKLARAGYRALETFPTITRSMLPASFRVFFNKGESYLAQMRPDIILSTYHLATMVATEAVARGSIDVPVISFVTDPLTANPLWADEDADTIIVSSEKAQDELVDMGVPRSRTVVLGYPVNNRFLDIRRPAGDIRSELGVESGEQVIVASAGGQGIGKQSTYLMNAYRRGVPFSIVFVCGRNEKLKAELEALVRTVESRTRLIPLGYVTNMNELFHVADLAVIKAGAATTFEALLMQTPVLFTDWATYNEKPNIDFVIDRAVGASVETEDEFFDILDRIYADDLISDWKSNLESLGLKSGANDIADLIVSRL